VLDPDEPITIGAMVGPEAFMEVRYLMHAKQRMALEAIPRIAGEFEQAFGRASGGLVQGYRLEDAETVVVALGSVLGTIEDVVDELRERGEKVGALAIRTFRPYPLEQVRAALAHARRVVVVEKAFAVGVGGIVGQNVRLALSDLDIDVVDVIAGLGGRAITSASLRRMLDGALAGRLPTLSFLDLDGGLVERELARTSGPHAENMLRDLAGRI
jgi:pyruvate ferredoxin oxidoreductase alpha subunit